MIQNLKTETGWHLRGTRRIGVSFDDVELIQQCVSTAFNPRSHAKDIVDQAVPSRSKKLLHSADCS